MRRADAGHDRAADRALCARRATPGEWRAARAERVSGASSCPFGGEPHGARGCACALLRRERAFRSKEARSRRRQAQHSAWRPKRGRIQKSRGRAPLRSSCRASSCAAALAPSGRPARPKRAPIASRRGGAASRERCSQGTLQLRTAAREHSRERARLSAARTGRAVGSPNAFRQRTMRPTAAVVSSAGEEAARRQRKRRGGQRAAVQPAPIVPPCPGSDHGRSLPRACRRQPPRRPPHAQATKGQPSLLAAARQLPRTSQVARQACLERHPDRHALAVQEPRREDGLDCVADRVPEVQGRAHADLLLVERDHLGYRSGTVWRRWQAARVVCTRM